jgi:hypothetical protein
MTGPGWPLYLQAQFEKRVLPETFPPLSRRTGEGKGGKRV